MPDLLLDHPTPNFEGLLSILRGEKTPERVPIIEIGIDPEVLQTIQETYLGELWVLPRGVHVLEKPDERYYRQLVNLYYRLGYDFVPIWPFWVNNPVRKVRRAADTGDPSSGTREWVDESGALIKSRANYESFPWEKIHAASETFEMVARCLPDGMKMTVIGSLFEDIFERLLGYEGLSYLMTDDPQLVEDVFNRWGQVVYDYYASVIGLEAVGGIFHVDDMGFKTGTLISPADLRRLLLPWLAKYAALAHEHGKPFWIHRFHSFQDVILPIGEVKARYGDRLALLGGVDMDKLATLPEDELRSYLRAILDSCMLGGRFALGSGNTIANYIPLKNFTILLEEAHKWKGR
jgi:uroporphyrinogen decarboxylase